MRAALDHHVALGQVLQNLGQTFAAIERRGDLVGVDARKLKEDVGADRHDRRAHLRRILFQELVGGNNGDAELARFGKQRIEPGIVGDQVLNLVAVQREQLPAPAGEQRVLEFGQQQAAQRRGLLAQPSFVEVQDHPPAAVHGVEQRKRRALLAENVAEPLVGGKPRNLVEDGVAVDALHRFAASIKAGLEVAGYFGVLNPVEAGGAEGGAGQQRRKLQQRQVVVGQHVQRVAQQFFGSCAEGIEIPPGL